MGAGINFNTREDAINHLRKMNQFKAGTPMASKKYKVVKTKYGFSIPL